MLAIGKAKVAGLVILLAGIMQTPKISPRVLAFL